MPSPNELGSYILLGTLVWLTLISLWGLFRK